MRPWPERFLITKYPEPQAGEQAHVEVIDVFPDDVTAGQAGRVVHSQSRWTTGFGMYVGATGYPPAVRTWLHLHHDDPEVGRVRHEHPEALTGHVEVRAFEIRPRPDATRVVQPEGSVQVVAIVLRRHTAMSAVEWVRNVVGSASWRRQEAMVETVGSTDFVVGWGTLSLINSGLAQGKNRSALGWWALSLLLGPVATLLIVVMPSREG